MLAMFALFLVLPAVLPRLGYTYLGTEVMIWAIFALGYNLLLGYTGLPAFGHGAFFGVGGYLLGMTQKWLTGGLALPAAGRHGRHAGAGRRRGAPRGAAPRDLLLAPHHRVRRHVLVLGLRPRRVDRRRGRAYRDQPAVRAGLPASGQRALLLLRLRVLRRGDGRALADRQLAVRRGHPGDPAERDASVRRRLRHGPVQVGGVHALLRLRRPGRRSLRAGPLRRLRRADEPPSRATSSSCA